MIITHEARVPERNTGLVTVNVDANAERIVVCDRLSCLPLIVTTVPQSGTFKRLVPFKYANSNNLLVGILDDGGQFNAAFADGVKAELVNAATVDMSQ